VWTTYGFFHNTYFWGNNDTRHSISLQEKPTFLRQTFKMQLFQSFVNNQKKHTHNPNEDQAQPSLNAKNADCTPDKNYTSCSWIKYTL